MRLIEIAVGTVLRIPESWDAFVYRGYLYKLHDGRRFVRMGEAKVA